MELIKVSIPNLTKFNPRADRANYSWLRLENDFFDDPTIFMLAGNEQRVYLRIICLASKENSSDVAFVAEQIASVLRISAAETVAAVHSLAQAELLEIKSGGLMTPTAGKVTADCRQSDTLRYDTIRDVTNVTKELKGAASAPPVPAASVLPTKQPGKVGGGDAERLFIATYVRAYQSRHGPNTRPECLNDGKTIGIVRNFLKNRPLDRACDLVQVYLQMDGEGDWFVKHHHDLVTFTLKINQIGLALQNGKDPSKPKTFLEYMQEREVANGTRGIQRASGETESDVPKRGIPERTC